jgi:hypothetical protein
MRPKHVLLVLGLSAAALPLGAQTDHPIIKRMDARYAALRSGQGREQFYSKDYVAINPQGVVTHAYQPAPTPTPDMRASDVKVVASTPHAVVVTLLQTPRPPTAAMPSATEPDLFLEVWANEQGTWRVGARQGVWVRKPEPAGKRVKAPNVSPYQPKTPAEAEILKANQAIEDAFLRHDAAAYGRNTIPEFVRISNFGQVVPRAEWMKANLSDNKDTRVMPVFDDVRIRVYEDVAVMTDRHVARDTDGTTTALPQRMMRAWVRRDGAWKLAATITTTVWPQKAQ